jgi:hypothetical protein
MSKHAVVSLVVGALAAAGAAAADPVPVNGTSVTYPQSVTVTVGDQPTRLALTGVGLRSKAIFNVYAVGSYVQDGAAARTAEDLAKTDAPRMLHLVMERTVGSADFIGAFRAAVGKTHPADAFAAEFAQLAAAVGDKAAEKGDHVTLLSSPGTGVRVRIAGKVDVTVRNPDFARALWEVYLGPKPIDEGLKKGLVSLLPR